MHTNYTNKNSRKKFLYPLSHAPNLIRGFSLIELLIVFGITAILATISLAGFSGSRDKSKLDATVQIFMSAIRNTQNKSITQENGRGWGLRLYNVPNNDHQYKIWSGENYETGTVDRLLLLKKNIRFGNPSSSSTYDIYFSKIKGLPMENKVISIFSGIKDLVQDVVINTNGLIVNREEAGMMGYWHLDEGTGGNTYDASGNLNTGSLMNNPTWEVTTNCKAGRCISFDGIDDNINISDSDSLDITNNFTVSFWIKSARTNQTNRYILAKGTSYDIIYEYVDNKIEWFGTFIGADPRPGSQITIDDIDWHHVAYSYDGATWAGYKDGVNVFSVPRIFSMETSGAPLTLGHRSVGDYFNGSLDEVRIYNRALSAGEINTLYNDFK